MDAKERVNQLVGIIGGDDYGLTLEDMNAIEQSLLATKRSGLENAAKICASIAAKWSHHSVAPLAAKECEDAIRALMETPNG